LADVDHIIVLCMENRSFDHYFGARKLLEDEASNGLNGDEVNLDMAQNPIGVFEMNNFEPEDPPHEWDQVHLQFNDGANDGFVTEQEKLHPQFKEEVMGYHVREQIPVLYGLADAYTLCDDWYCSLLGPTWPNRWYLHAASSGGEKANDPGVSQPKNIMEACEDNGISSNNYYDGLVPWVWGAYPVEGQFWTDSIDEFFDKLDGGGLEQVVILDPDFLANDDHPAHNILLGQAFIATVYQALAESQYWDKCLLLITYDEHGGFYDHVPPPAAEDDDPDFRQLGFRVPTVVVGPTVARGCINSTRFEHASFAATVTRKHSLSELTTRSAAANDLSACINPEFLGDPQPPAELPKVQISWSEIEPTLGRVTSQTELFDAVGIQVPLKGPKLARYKKHVRAMLERGRRLGVVDLVD
jgi:phospholipase C